MQDCWNSSYLNAPSDGTAWLTGECSRRIFRGGGWGDNPKFARSSLRNRADSDSRKDEIGFRLVMIPKQ
jgi:formylglycine-generating enzyme required for sulfatase activity